MNGKEQEIYLFDTFQLDVGKGVLFRDELPVSLQWKAFEVLCVLVRSKGRLITRDEIIEEVWPDSFVEENNLSQHIRSIRKALGDGENGNKFIETVPRRGFRFLPEVTKLSAQSPENIDAIAAERTHAEPIGAADDKRVEGFPPKVVQPRPRKWMALVTLFAFGAVALIAVYFWVNRESPTERRVRYANQIRLAASALELSLIHI